MLRRTRLQSIFLSVCSMVKPIGKPDAGNPPVRFDERGRETERCRMAQATAPFLDSTAPRAGGWPGRPLTEENPPLRRRGRRVS